MSPQYPQTLFVGVNSVSEYTDEPWSEIERDPRGVLLMWEPPIPGAKYVMGLDPTEGITGWNRAVRVDGDHKTDNGAIVILRVDGMWEKSWKERPTATKPGIPDVDPVTNQQRRIYKDVQVAEFAAPCDAVEIARVANLLGRIYAGDEDDQCLLIHEAWPGPGMLTTQELIRLGYGNLFHWQYIDSNVEDTNRLGWRSTRESQKLLWYRSRRHLMNRQAVIRSKYLLDEYSNAEIDMDKQRARAAYGYHDDRFQAANMAFWASHGWTYDAERTDLPVTETPVVDYQRLAPGLDDYQSFSQWKEEFTADWG